MIRIKLNLFFILFLFVSIYIGYIHQSLIIFASVLLHEIGHVVVAKLLGIKVEEIELFPFGGVAKMEDITKYGGYMEAFIAIAGPGVTAFIAIIGIVFSGQNELLKTIGQFNIILLTFNIMPALPMDGGRIIRNILLHFMSYKQATKTMVISGRLTAIALVLYNIYIIYKGSNSVAYIITALFIYLGCHKELRYCSYYYLLNRNNSKKGAAGKKGLKTRILKLHQDSYVRFAVNQFSPGSICIIHVIDDSGRVIKTLSEADIMDAFLKYGYDSKIGQIKSHK
ncbi:MAG: M50 family metallopeptidase [Lutisporaceae bacterium]